MKLLEEHIIKYGTALNNEVLKVDSFINHQIDPNLMMKLAKDIQDYFKEKEITKIVTIETSGIAPSVFLGYLLNVPVVYLKKNSSKIIGTNCYQTVIHSFTKDVDYLITCDKKYIKESDKVLFVDDFMANGEACLGAIDILKQANASIEGIAIIIEKAFQSGRQKVEALGYDIYSLARIASLENGNITFTE